MEVSNRDPVGRLSRLGRNPDSKFVAPTLDRGSTVVSGRQSRSGKQLSPLLCTAGVDSNHCLGVRIRTLAIRKVN